MKNTSDIRCLLVKRHLDLRERYALLKAHYEWQHVKGAYETHGYEMYGFHNQADWYNRAVSRWLNQIISKEPDNMCYIWYR